MIDKINDEFIVDCTNNSKEERQQVYKFLVDNRNYDIQYLSKNYPIIVCNKQHGASNWDTLIQYYNGFNAKKDIPVYTFEQFKEMYLDENDMKTYTIEELRNAPIQIKVHSEEQAIQLAYAVGHKAAWKPFNPEYPIYCYLDNWNYPTWNSSENERKSDKPTTIEFNQIKNFMEKKIIGYKLIKPEYKEASIAIVKPLSDSSYKSWESNIIEHGWTFTSASVHANILQKAGVLDLWFEPVYEGAFKVGDWVITKGYHKDYDGIALKITLIDNKKYCYFEHNDIGTPNFNIKNIVRKATPEEIQQAQKTIVKMYSSNKGEFEIEVVDGKAYYKPENKELPKEWIKSIIGSYHHWRKEVNTNYPYDIKVDGVDVGCYSKTKKEDWEKVYKLLK